eukprot:GHUV01036937.1.p1 GENE.GHUV01036937.1~~GHUV01036937.1.p1  ORF type:complete len:149 (+),score=11.85 GHUV01036937.1:106-552(+)
MVTMIRRGADMKPNALAQKSDNVLASLLTRLYRRPADRWDRSEGASSRTWTTAAGDNVMSIVILTRHKLCKIVDGPVRLGNACVGATNKNSMEDTQGTCATCTKSRAEHRPYLAIYFCCYDSFKPEACPLHPLEVLMVGEHARQLPDK